MSEITVQATQRSYELTPVGQRLSEDFDPGGTVILKEKESEKIVPAQIEKNGKEARLRWIIDTLARGEKREYSLEEGKKESKGVRVQQKEEGRVEIFINDHLFTVYNCGSNVIRPYFYPLNGPFGVNITRHYPMREIEGETRDHRHHRSLYFAHGDVNGVDNWSENEGCGFIRHRKFTVLSSGAVYGHLVSVNDWVDSQENKIMEEKREVKIYNLPLQKALIDVRLTFQATEGDVIFGDTKEGGLVSVRVATSMDASERGQITNSFGGNNEAETWGKRAHWCDYSGPIQTSWGDLWAGIAVFDTPGNFRHPTYWHVRNYGLMTANPFGLSYFKDNDNLDGSFHLPEGETTSFAYRIYLHPGTARQGRVSKKYQEYINPPETALS